MIWFLLSLIVATLITTYLMYRVSATYKERVRVIEVLRDRALDSLDDGKFDKDFLNPFHRHTFNEMVLKIWKPVKSFYRDIK